MKGRGRWEGGGKGGSERGRWEERGERRSKSQNGNSKNTMSNVHQEGMFVSKPMAA